MKKEIKDECLHLLNGMSIKDVYEAYKQPDWCKGGEIVMHPQLGCSSLMLHIEKVNESISKGCIDCELSSNYK